jgi:hypothetical protein
MLKFYVGSHHPHWLWTVSFPLFVSHRRLVDRKVAGLRLTLALWALGSGGFIALSLYGRWQNTAEQYADAVQAYAGRIGRLDFAAPQDWMCGSIMLARPGLSLREHQERTVANFVQFRDLPETVQGWRLADYVLRTNSAAEVNSFPEAFIARRLARRSSVGVRSQESAANAVEVDTADTGIEEILLDVEAVEGGQNGSFGRGASIREDGLDDRSLVLSSHRGEQGLQGRGGYVVVRSDGAVFDVGQRQQQERDQPGAVSASATVEQDTAGAGLGDRFDDGSAAVGFPFEEDPVVERAAVELLTVEVLPELDVVDVIEGHLNAIDAERCGRPCGGSRELRRTRQRCWGLFCVGPNLVSIAQVNDGSNTGLSRLGPAYVGNETKIRRPEESSVAGLVTRPGRQTTEISGVEKAFPVHCSARAHGLSIIPSFRLSATDGWSCIVGTVRERSSGGRKPVLRLDTSVSSSFLPKCCGCGQVDGPVLRSQIAHPDSMAWSVGARQSPPLPDRTTHRNCASCHRYAARWRRIVLPHVTGARARGTQTALLDQHGQPHS